MSIIEEIKCHEEIISSGQVPSGLEQCLICKKKPEIFYLHSYRERVFLAVIAGFVQKIKSFLSRWKCPLCHGSFTYYPDFALPCKRYIKSDILIFSNQYIEGEDSTYRNTVQDNGLSIGYNSSNAGKIDERSLSSSTLWRWLSFIGLHLPLSNAFKLIRQKYPASEIFQHPDPVQIRKYRSTKRRKILQRGIRFFIAKRQHSELFSITIFPDFAANCC